MSDQEEPKDDKIVDLSQRLRDLHKGVQRKASTNKDVRIGIAKPKIPLSKLKDWEPTDEQRFAVRIMVAVGNTLKDVGLVIRPDGTISGKAVKHFFKDEIRLGELEANKKVVEVAYKMATSGRHPGMTRFWLERRLGWGETKSKGEVEEDMLTKVKNSLKAMRQSMPKPSSKDGTNAR